jgi:hypothetical protein
MLVPHPLHVRIVEPTLLEWTMVEPQCSEPHRWLGGYEHLKQAVHLDPRDHLAARNLIVCILGRVGSSADHLPKGYLGEPHKDLDALTEAEGLLSTLPSGDDRAAFAAEIGEDRLLIKKYLRNHR